MDFANHINPSEKRQLSNSSPREDLGRTACWKVSPFGGCRALLTRIRERDRLILDRDLPQQESRLGIGTNPVDIDEASQFTLEAELVRLSSLLKEKGLSMGDQRATNNEIRRRMKQAKEDRDKLSERGIAAFEYLKSTVEIWDGGAVNG
jgi:hypothetical protein